MAGAKTTRQLAQATADYLSLVRRCPLRPIRNEAELDRAQAMLDSLLDRDRLDSTEADYLDVLSDLVKRYEEEAHEIETDDLSDVEMLEHLIEAKEVKQAEVARRTGIAESTISELLAGRKRLNRVHIEKLARYFHVNPGVFLAARRQAEA